MFSTITYEFFSSIIINVLHMATDGIILICAKPSIFLPYSFYIFFIDLKNLMHIFVIVRIF